MRNEVHYNPKAQKRRWLGYFDLLGTRARIESGRHLQVFSIYAQAVEAATSASENAGGAIGCTCFSDTFIIYSVTDSGEAFAYVDMVARWFTYKLIVARIPVRGALSCGEFYADDKHSLFFGPALIEAYDYGEAQDWLGFMLTPSAVLQLDKLNLPASKRLNYAYWKIPFKRESRIDQAVELPACIFGQWITLNGKNPCMEALGEMKDKASESTAGKYARAMEFIEKNRRTPVRTEAK